MTTGPDADRTRRRAIVRGRVQGVGFRWATAEQAQRLGVAGSARNLADGSVEVVAEGGPAEVGALLDWLRSGPATSRVESVDVSEEPVTGERGFRAG